MDTSESAIVSAATDLVGVDPSHRPVEIGRIGDAFAQSGRLSAADISRVVAVQEKKHLRFGDAAVSLGLVSEQEVWRVLSRQYRYPTVPADSPLMDYPIVGAPFSPEAEAIRKLRTQIVLTLDMRGTQSLAVLGPSGGEGKTYLAESLAMAFAQNGQRILLINADLRKQQKTALLGAQPRGLSSVLSGRQSLHDCVAATTFPSLMLLDSGPLPPNPAELLSSPALAGVIDQVRGQFDLVIVDTPAANRFPEVQLIAQQVGASLIVARQRRTPLGEFQRTKRLVQVAGGRLLGGVYNAFAD